MGIIIDILKNIPLTAVLHERLSEQEHKMSHLESENKVLKSKVIDLVEVIRKYHANSESIANANKTKPLDIREFTFSQLGYYTHPDYTHPICPNCLNKTPSLPSPVVLSGKGWHCPVCDKSGGEGEVFTVDW